ncbi:MAG: DUF523 domain-containing protein [Desulfobacterota bacterium]|nr:DUF523 domain-containing protein [Thermodesulfobacteriota bacterium]
MPQSKIRFSADINLPKEKIKVAVSACLLGKNTRYDGENKSDQFIKEDLGKIFDLIPICPEVEFGFSVPREPLQLVGNPFSPRIMTRETKKDHTTPMLLWAKNRVLTLKQEGVKGFILKSNSPTCGIKQVKVYCHNGIAVKKGVGLFVRVLKEYFPFAPMEDEKRIHNDKIYQRFIEKIFFSEIFLDKQNNIINNSNSYY